MKRRGFVSRLGAIALSVVLIVGCSPTMAFAYNASGKSPLKTWSFSPNCWSYNGWTFTQYGYYIADCTSDMNIANTGVLGINEWIKSQAAITWGRADGTEHNQFGTAVLSMTANPAYNYVTSTTSKELQTLKGDVGALSWGQGTVRSADGVSHDINSDYLLSATINENGEFTPGSTVRNADKPTDWVPGASNFTGEDGLLYGVPFIENDGSLTIPDMARVELEDGTSAYVSIREMDLAIFDGALTDDEKLAALERIKNEESEILRDAFEEYTGIDSLDIAIARDCLDALCLGGEPEDITRRMTDSVRARTASDPYAINAEITPHDLKCILDIAEPHMRVSVPAYGADGVSVVGKYSFGRM